MRRGHGLFRWLGAFVVGGCLQGPRYAEGQEGAPQDASPPPVDAPPEAGASAVAPADGANEASSFVPSKKLQSRFTRSPEAMSSAGEVKEVPVEAGVVAPPPAPRQLTEGRLSLSTMYYKESQGLGAGGAQLQNASPDTLLAADLRGLITTKQIEGTLWSSTVDFRLRATGSYASRDNSLTSPLISARGYRGGREYDLRQLYGEYNGAVRLTIGRQLVFESDATQIDGVRAVFKAGSWELGGFGGLYPDPFSRNLATDYRSSLVYAFGATAAFRYSSIYGSVAQTAIVPTGQNDGNVVTNDAVGPTSTEKPRVFTSVTAFSQPSPLVDLFTYLVFDAVSEAGPQLTNGHFLANFHPDRDWRVQVSYHHMATLAIELFVKDLLIQPRGGTVENNLIVQRIARDEGRVLVDYYFDKRRQYDAFAEGRIRRRSAIDGANDPVSGTRGAQTASELSAGARGRGKHGLRYGARMTGLFDFRATSYVFQADVGRDFLANDALSLDGTASYWHSKDKGQTAGCAANDNKFDDCFGDTTQDLLDVGGDVIYRPNPTWMLIADYHWLLERNLNEEAIKANVLFFRAGYRF